MLEPSDDPKGREQARAVAVAAQLGLAAGTPIIAGALGGYYLEQRHSTGGFWVVGGVLLGLAAGIAAAYRLLAPYLHVNDDDKKR